MEEEQLEAEARMCVLRMYVGLSQIAFKQVGKEECPGYIKSHDTGCAVYYMQVWKNWHKHIEEQIIHFGEYVIYLKIPV